MASLQNLSTREKAIMSVMAAMLVALGAYYGLLTGFVEEYQGVSRNLETARSEYEMQQKLLRTEARVNREYDEIARSLPKAMEGKTPEAAFTEDVAAMCRELGITLPNINPHKVAPADVEGYSYLILPISGINGDLGQITRILKRFSERNLLITDLNIRSASLRKTAMPVSVSVAQIVRTEDLSPESRRTR